MLPAWHEADSGAEAEGIMADRRPNVPRIGKIIGKRVAFVGRFGPRGWNLRWLQSLAKAEGGALVDDPLQTPPDLLVVGAGVGGKPPAVVAKVQKKHPHVQVLDEGAFHRTIQLTAADFAALMQTDLADHEWETIQARLQKCGGGPDLSGSDFSKRRLGGDWNQVKLNGCDFRSSRIGGDFPAIHGAKFDDARLYRGSFSEAEDCSFQRALFEGVVLDPGKFTRCDFSEAKFVLVRGWEVRAVGCVFQKADLHKADFRTSKFPASDFHGANLSGGDLKECDFTGANLSGADLSGADLQQALLVNADLSGANLRNAVLSNADLSGAIVDDADFAGALVGGANLAAVDLSKAKNLQVHTTPAVGPNLKALAQAAQVAERLGASIQIDCGEQEPVLAEVRAFVRYGMKLVSTDDPRLMGDRAKSVLFSDSGFADAVLRQAEAHARGKPLFSTVTADVKKGDVKKGDFHGPAARKLAVAAWHEAFGVPVPSEEELARLVEQADADAEKLRDALVARLRTGRKAVEDWNSHASRERAVFGRLHGLNLAGADLERVDFAEMDLTGAVLAGANLWLARFTEARVQGVDFSKCALGDADFSHAKASGASFEGAALWKAGFYKADLRGCNFRGANLSESKFMNADIRGADIREAKLASMTFYECKYDEKTLFPPGYVSPSRMVWAGAGPDPSIPPTPPARPAGSLSFVEFVEELEEKAGAGRLQKARTMLKAERFQLFAEVKDDRLLGIVKSQSSKELAYSCRLTAEGAFGCCTQNLRPCGGLRGALCKHLLVLIVGLAKAGRLDPATVDHWIDLSRRLKPAIEEAETSDVFLRFKGAEAGEIDWRPTETIPEDFYSM